MTWELGLVKNNNISIFIYFLDAVVKPRHDIEQAFQALQQTGLNKYIICQIKTSYIH
mgnify:CR=1 FL=1